MTDFSAFPKSLPCPYGPYRAIVIDVHDGDTVRLLIDTGFGQRVEEAIRVYGINAPELSTAEGKESRDFLLGLIPIGTAVRLTSLVARTEEQTMSFARYVGSIEYFDIIADDGHGKTFDVATTMWQFSKVVYCDRNLNPIGNPLPPIERWNTPKTGVPRLSQLEKFRCPKCSSCNSMWTTVDPDPKSRLWLKCIECKYRRDPGFQPISF